MKRVLFSSLFVIMAMRGMDNEPTPLEDLSEGAYTICGIGHDDKGVFCVLSREEQDPPAQLPHECDGLDKIACALSAWGVLHLCGIVPCP